MNRDRIKRLPRWSWRQAVAVPRMEKGRLDRAVFGFDTEYDSQTGELLSVQLYRDGCAIYHPVPRRFRMTYANLRALIAPYHAPFLIAFFSLADISKIANYWDARISDTGLGMIYAEYGDMTIFDIGTFWSSDRTFSLRRLGALIGLPKLDWDTRNVSRETLTKPGFREYAMRDAEICYRAYETFLREPIDRLFGVDIMNFRSSPSISAYIFRSRLSQKITAPPGIVRTLALRAYWGGRAEIFKTGTHRGNIVEIDANSEYPRSAISLGDLPDGNDWEIIRGSDWHNCLDGFVEVLFAYPRLYRGFYGLPVEWQSRLYWPRAGLSFCTMSELRAAIEHCPEMRYDIRLAVGYKTAARSELNRYLADLLTKKDAATGADRYVYKLLANSIIGKLAQNKRVTNDGLHIARAADIGCPPDFLNYRGKMRIETGSCYWPEAASLILGKARAVLYGAMQKIGRERLFLCSTDSLVYDGTAAEFSIDGVPFEVKTSGDSITVWREKVYCIQKAGAVLKVAHHALPVYCMLDKDAIVLDENAETVEVNYKEFIRLPGARRGGRFGDVVHRQKIVSLKPSKWSAEI